MRKIYKLVVALCVAMTLTFSGFTQNNFFTAAGENRVMPTTGQRVIIPEKFYTSSLDVAGIRNFLWSLPSEQSLGSNRGGAPVLTLPMPDGSVARFKVWESNIQEPALQAKFPEIKTFLGQGIDDPYATVRFDYNPYFGFSAQILSPNGRIYIDPYARRDINTYISYYHTDNNRVARFNCRTEESLNIPKLGREENILAGPCRGTQLTAYRLVISCAGEYAQVMGSGLAGPTHAAIVTTVNRVTQVYELELAVRLVLVANNNLVEFLDPATDPYANDGDDDLDVITGIINNAIGVSNYDIGHLFCTHESGGVGAGVAYLRVVCDATLKGGGLTGRANPTGDGYDIDYVAHEMGHQFGANHTFNSSTCFSAGGSYEPGGGTTIMAYAGICAPNENIQPNSDPIFHAKSFDDISTFLSSGGGAGCGTPTATGNTLPLITSMGTNNFSIPIGTPFTLTATAVDPDNDPITYNWEGWDVGAQGSSWLTAANSTTRPLFRTRLSKTNGSRTFPDIRVIAANYPGNTAPSAMDGLRGEVLPNVARVMKFRLTVRDVHAGIGGIVSAGQGCQDGTTFQVNAVGTLPFRVASPNGGESLTGGGSQTILWDVAGTDAVPINVSTVKISLSTDGGLTYPTVLAASTANDGSESLTLPSISTTTARIKVEALGNIFFDISNANFTITASSIGFDFNTPAAATASCPAPASMDIVLGTTSFLGFSNTITLSSNNPNITFVPGNTVTPGNSVTVRLTGTNILSAGSYAVIITGTATGAATRTRELTYIIQPGAAPSITLQPQAQQACIGTNATFTVTAPTALSYQWQVNPNGTGTFSNIGGATGASYTQLAVATAMNNNQYRVIVTGQCNSVTSAFATLTVQTAPAITAQPQSVTLCTSTNNTFSVTANGTNLTYEWQLSTDGGANYNPAPGANTSSTYTVSSLTAGMNNNRYRVVVSGTCAPAAISSAAILTVISPVTITTQPNNAAICATIGTTNFTVAGSGTGVLYQWEVSTNGGGVYTDVPGATAATLTVSNPTDAMNGNLYRAKLYNATCTIPAVSNAAVLTVLIRSSISLAATSTSLQPGQVSTLTATAAPASGVTYAWYKDGVLLPAVTGTSYPVDVTKLGAYQVKIINQSGCTNESNVVTIGASASERLFIFPSPNDGQFTVSYYNSGGATQQRLAIYDSKGAMVYNKSLAVTGPYQLHSINLKGSGRGVYIVVIGDANGKRLAKGKVVIN
ncbi:MAG: reprolysin-like metallopeptidase [Chitinophagaceae bacterium]